MPDPVPYGDLTPTGALVRVKVVPGARQDAVAGLLGDRLKLRVRAPAESGRANRAATLLLAAFFRVDPRAVKLVSGQRQPRKCFLIKGVQDLPRTGPDATMDGAR